MLPEDGISLTVLVVSGTLWESLIAFLCPDDNCEAGVLGSCSCSRRDATLTLRLESLRAVSGGDVRRGPGSVEWNSGEFEQFFAEEIRFARIIAVLHTHPNGIAHFSPQDDDADRIMESALRRNLGSDQFLASGIMVPDGHIVARLVKNGQFYPIDRVELRSE